MANLQFCSNLTTYDFPLISFVRQLEGSPAVIPSGSLSSLSLSAPRLCGSIDFVPVRPILVGPTGSATEEREEKERDAAFGGRHHCSPCLSTAEERTRREPGQPRRRLGGRRQGRPSRSRPTGLQARTDPERFGVGTDCVISSASPSSPPPPPQLGCSLSFSPGDATATKNVLRRNPFFSGGTTEVVGVPDQEPWLGKSHSVLGQEGEL